MSKHKSILQKYYIFTCIVWMSDTTFGLFKKGKTFIKSIEKLVNFGKPPQAFLQENCNHNYMKMEIMILLANCVYYEVHKFRTPVMELGAPE